MGSRFSSLPNLASHTGSSHAMSGSQHVPRDLCDVYLIGAGRRPEKTKKVLRREEQCGDRSTTAQGRLLLFRVGVPEQTAPAETPPSKARQGCAPRGGRQSGEVAASCSAQSLYWGGQSSWITGRCKQRVLRTLPGRALGGEAAAGMGCREPWCQSLLNRPPGQRPGALASQSFPLGHAPASLLSVCL